MGAGGNDLGEVAGVACVIVAEEDPTKIRGVDETEHVLDHQACRFRAVPVSMMIGTAARITIELRYIESG